MRSVAQFRLVLRQKMSQLCCSVKLLHRFFRSGYNLCPLRRALGMWGSDSPRNSADETGKRMLLSFSVKAVCYVYLASLKYFSVGWITGIKANTFTSGTSQEFSSLPPYLKHSSLSKVSLQDVQLKTILNSPVSVTRTLWFRFTFHRRAASLLFQRKWYFRPPAFSVGFLVQTLPF